MDSSHANRSQTQKTHAGAFRPPESSLTESSPPESSLTESSPLELRPPESPLPLSHKSPTALPLASGFTLAHVTGSLRAPSAAVSVRQPRTSNSRRNPPKRFRGGSLPRLSAVGSPTFRPGRMSIEQFRLLLPLAIGLRSVSAACSGIRSHSPAAVHRPSTGTIGIQ